MTGIRLGVMWLALGLVAPSLVLVAPQAQAARKKRKKKAAAAPVAEPAEAKKRLSPKESEEARRLAEEEAEKARKEREARVPEVVKEAERKKDVDASTGPRLSVEQFRRTTELQVQKKRDEQLQTLDQIIKLGPPKEELPALLFQKAELYQENAQYFFFQGMERDEEMIQAREKGDKATQKKAKKAKEELLASSRRWTQDADRIYEEIIAKHPKFDRMDQVLYALGRARWDAGNQKEALEVYRQLIQQHPKSPFVADAYLAFGEYHFGNKKVENALEAYKKAAAFEESKVFGYAVYKQGWCHYNMAQWEQAAEKFKEVVLYSQLNEDTLGDKRILLTREARKDYVTVYSHFGDANGALEDFKTLAEGDEHWKMVERLAGLYFSEGQDREAAVVYLKMTNTNKESTRNPFYLGRIVSSAARQGNKRIVVKFAHKLVEEFKRVRDAVPKMDEKDPHRARAKEDLADAEDLADNTLRSLATTWHNEARKTRDDETYELSYDLYKDYLDLFPNKKPAYDMRFFYAELNYKLEKFDEAARQYSLVVAMDPKGKWAEPSAEEAVRAYDELVQEFEKKQRKEKQATDFDPSKIQPIPEIKQRMVDACEVYLKYFGKGKVATEARYKIARTYYDVNDFDRALTGFNQVIDTASDHPRAEQAASLILDIHNLREDWDSLYNAARAFQKNKKLMAKEEFAKATGEVLESSSFKVISKLQRQGKYEEAAKAYLSFADEFRKSELADKSLANAAANFQLAGMPQKAVQVREMLIDAFPKSTLVPDALYAVAESHEAVAELEKAASVLERFYAAYPKDARAKDALFNAGIYREGYGGNKNVEKAVADREKYLKDYPKASDATAVLKSICRLWEATRNVRKAVDCWESFAGKIARKDPEGAWDARFKAVDLQRKILKGNKADDAFNKLALQYRKKHRRMPQGSNVAARLAFLDADYRFTLFKREKIDSPDLRHPNKFKKSVTHKAKGRDEIRKVYTDVVRLKDPEYAIAALYRIGELNIHYMDVLRSVPPPKEFPPAQREIFKDRMAQNAAPIEEEAVGAFRICVQKSQELHVFNTWTQKCLDVLEQKRPEAYPKIALEPLAAPPVQPPMPHFLVVDFPKDGGDLVSTQVPPPVLAPLAAVAPAAPQDAANGAANGNPEGGEAEADDEHLAGGGGP